MAYYPLATEFGAHYRLVGADGVSVATFNDIADANYVGALTEVTGLDSADVRESASDMVESDGGTHGNFYLGRRPITLSGKVFGHATLLERNTRLDRARRASLALRGDSLLYWKPSVRKENLAPNPSVEVDLTGWSGGTLSRVADTSLGSAFVAERSNATGVTAYENHIGASGNAQGVNGIPAKPGRTYGVSLRAKVQSVTGGTVTLVKIMARFYYDNGVQIGPTLAVDPTSSSIVTNPVTGTAYTLSGTVVAPTGSAFVAIRPYFDTSASAAVAAVRYDNLIVSESSSVPTYFDGDSPGYYWQGDANVSPSGDFIEQFIPVRRAGPFRESGQWVKDFQIPLVSEYAYIFGSSVKTVAGGVAAENRGNVPAYPIVSITGASSNPTVSDGTRTFRTTGLSAGAALVAGETVEFDMLTHTGKFTAGARNGQSANRYIDWATTGWPYLTGLGTTQTFTLTGGGTLSVRYRDAWA